MSDTVIDTASDLAAAAFQLPAELTIFSAADTHVALLGWLAGQGEAPPLPLQVEADQVIDVDAAGVQLLCALSASLEQRGWDWQLGSPTRILTQACARLGLADWLAAHAEVAPS
ncbi:MAG: STAS domain-containing protein [Leptothrix sp. (in: b-proteobacteria)]